MDIGSLAGLSNQNIQRSNAKLQATIASLVSSSRINKASDDIASLSLATQLQSSLSSLKQVSTNLVQDISLTQVADGGVSKIQDALQELKSLAQQAQNPALNEQNRKALNDQFKQVTAEIDRLAGSTNFNGKKLLNGEISGDDKLSLSNILGGAEDAETETLTIDDLSSSALFDGADLNLLTADNAKAAVEAISTALGRTTSTRASIGAFQQALDFVSGGIDSAVTNQEAARSILQDTDFGETSSLFSLITLQSDISLALAAQGNRLSPTLLKLIG